MTPLRCERCARPGLELALDIGCFRYLCERCWGSGSHVCEECESTLACCGCRGRGCLSVIEGEPAVEVEGAA